MFVTNVWQMLPQKDKFVKCSWQMLHKILAHLPVYSKTSIWDLLENYKG